MGLNHPIESLLIAPDRYEDYRTVITDFSEITTSAADEPVVYRVRIKSDADGNASIRGYGNKYAPVPRGGYKDPEKCEMHNPFAWGVQRIEIDVEDARGAPAIQTVFHVVRPYMDLRAGEILLMRGTAARLGFANKLYFKAQKRVPESELGRIRPVYLGAQGKQVNTDEVHAMMNWLVSNDAYVLQAYERACEAIREDCGGLTDEQILHICTPVDSAICPETLSDLLTTLHAPSRSVEDGRAAIAIGAKVCALSLQCRAQRQNARPECAEAALGAGIDLKVKMHEVISHVERRLGYKLTNNQTEVIDAIVDRFPSTAPLNGLLSGEVGSGKTLAYAIPAVIAQAAGGRVAIMAPTDLLANQIASVIATIFGDDVMVERVRTGGKIKNPDAILVGTPGLTSRVKSAEIEINFLVIDEEHKHSIDSRDSMKTEKTHVLCVSATPIPRSLALSLYDGMDLFTLNEQPVKKNIQTALIGISERKIASAAIQASLAGGKRVAIVYTLVDQAEGTPGATIDAPEKHRLTTEEKIIEERSRKSAIESAQLFEQAFPGKVVLLHGKMTTAEKIAALDYFRSGEKPLIITTTIFETGIDVPSVETIIVRDPEYLGLSQLHQLRGRLARNGGDGKCILLAENLDTLSEETYGRLNTFCKNNDGYALALADMLARGAGDLEGLQQQGKATTTFKGIKMTTHDLLLNQENRADLTVEAQSQWQEHTQDRRQRQSNLFG